MRDFACGFNLKVKRSRVGKTYFAEIAADGGILVDGQEFRSPSRAAMVASGMRAVDGWHAWVVTQSGRPLDSLRGELLDEVATRSEGGSSDEGEGDSSASERRHEFLKEARKGADSSNPIEISVRDLLDRWRAKGRGDRVSQRIEADLANHGRITSPSFRKVTLDATVQLINTGQVVNASSKESEVFAAEPSDMDDIGGLDRGLTVGNLPSALGGVVSMAPDATFDEAITLMLLNDYSQLAVLAGKHTLRGAVTWKSIAQLRHSKPSAIFAKAIFQVDAVRYDKELIDVLPTLEVADFVFVRDEKNAIAGIVNSCRRGACLR